jgi:hypothetical protein
MKKLMFLLITVLYVQNVFSQLPTSSIILTTNVNEVKVKLNDREVGFTADGILKIKELKVGTYNLEISNDDYFPVIENIVLNQASHTFHYDLKPRPATLTLKSDPTALTVKIDDDYAGETTLTKVLEPRLYDVSMESGKYKFQKKIDLKANQVLVEDIDFHSYLTLEPSLKNCRLKINGIDKQSFVPLQFLPGKYKIEVYGEYINKYSSSIELFPNRSYNEKIQLSYIPEIASRISYLDTRIHDLHRKMDYYRDRHKLADMHEFWEVDHLGLIIGLNAFLGVSGFIPFFGNLSPFVYSDVRVKADYSFLKLQVISLISSIGFLEMYFGEGDKKMNEELIIANIGTVAAFSVIDISIASLDGIININRRQKRSAIKHEINTYTDELNRYK